MTKEELFCEYILNNTPSDLKPLRDAYVAGWNACKGERNHVLKEIMTKHDSPIIRDILLEILKA